MVDEFGRYQDDGGDDAVERALRSWARAAPAADTASLVAGARRRARTLQRRRRGVAGVVAVAALVVPFAVSQNDPAPRPNIPVAVTPTPTAPVTVPEENLLSGAYVASALPGAVRDRTDDVVETPDSELTGGICLDLPVPAGTRLLAGRTATWKQPLDPTRVGQPALTESVRVFEGTGSQAYLEFAQAQAQACVGQSEESGPWSIYDRITDGVMVQAYAQVQSAPQAFWTVRIVDVRGRVVVDVSLSAFADDPEDLLGQARSLVTAALEQNADLQ